MLLIYVVCLCIVCCITIYICYDAHIHIYDTIHIYTYYNIYRRGGGVLKKNRPKKDTPPEINTDLSGGGVETTTSLRNEGESTPLIQHNSSFHVSAHNLASSAVGR